MTPPPRGRSSQSSDSFLLDRLRKRRRTRARNKRKRVGKLALGALIGTLLFLVVSSFTGAAIFMNSCDLNSLKPVEVGQNSFVFAADGSLLGSIPAERNRQPVTLAQISKWVPDATIAIEDRRFYKHGALDWLGIVRALYADVKAGRVVQGGSTITQQLVRNLYISNKSQTLGRKTTEACLAIKLAREKSKQWILTAYMNQVYYGNHAYGIEAAAQTYFSKPARKLTLNEAALIAGLPQAPSLFDPFQRPAPAIARRDDVLRAMLGNGVITSSQYANAVAKRNLHLKAGRLYTRIREPYFFSYVREELQRQYGANTVRSGGLKVYTTIDPRLQRFALDAIKRTLPYSSDPAAAIVSINPSNGAIRAMTEVSPGNPKNQVNFASSARRQPGSTFKTIVLTTAVAQGIDPATTTYLSAPFKYDPTQTGSCDTNPPTAWCPQTYDHTYAGPISIESGTLRSDNTVYARLSLDVGPENIAKMAYDLGVKTDLRTSDGAYVPSMGLGSRVVTPMDMASVYSTLAAGGIYSKPMAIRKVILPGGKVDKEAGWGVPQRRRAVPDWVAATVVRILEENMTSGTGVGAYFGKLSGGKTGTTDNFADAWFCGFVPGLEATIWLGYPKGEIPMTSVHGIAVSGPTFPATIWKLFMERASYYAPFPKEFPTPKDSPVWVTHQLQYALSGGTYTPSSSTPAAPTTTSSGNSSDGFSQVPGDGTQP
ncbi:MAG: penicillin-binding protein [Gaiellaceae bacterium]|nr:penicillin-binding protein [Gaiellaceae bacterium]MDX6388220.1 penicillin-binding protein [Gaiellaceae bacterium]MDX6436540.1 penicillin-binding protein [Gaiellaceae bacterium]